MRVIHSPLTPKITYRFLFRQRNDKDTKTETHTTATDMQGSFFFFWTAVCFQVWNTEWHEHRGSWTRWRYNGSINHETQLCLNTVEQTNLDVCIVYVVLTTHSHYRRPSDSYLIKYPSVVLEGDGQVSWLSNVRLRKIAPSHCVSLSNDTREFGSMTLELWAHRQFPPNEVVNTSRGRRCNGRPISLNTVNTHPIWRQQPNHEDTGAYFNK